MNAVNIGGESTVGSRGSNKAKIWSRITHSNRLELCSSFKEEKNKEGNVVS
jgi:hypothetical protein